jgi:hypothetical protein
VAKTNSRVNPTTDQFIVRLLPHKATGQLQLMNELVVRLDNGFPTTEREARQFEERQEANLKALAREMLGKVQHYISPIASEYLMIVGWIRILFWERRRMLLLKLVAMTPAFAALGANIKSAAGQIPFKLALIEIFYSIKLLYFDFCLLRRQDSKSFFDCYSMP